METDIKKALRKAAKRMPQRVIERINQGDVIHNRSYCFEVDDINVYHQLGSDPDKTIFEAIYNSVGLPAYDNSTIQNVLKNLPSRFSEILKQGFGACLEKAVLTQLIAQNLGDSFMIGGFLGVRSKGHAAIVGHAFNVVFRNGKPYIVDSQNPLEFGVDKKITKPCVIPVTGIDSHWVFEIPSKYHERTYSVK